jgi:hypothetical protein
MADMYDSGRECHEAWRRGAKHVVRYLGDYNRDLPIEEVEKLLDYTGKISESGLEKFRRGWSSVA